MPADRTTVRPRFVAEPEPSPTPIDVAPIPRSSSRPRPLARTPLNRQLRAIIAADVVGYTECMAMDEDATHRAFRLTLRHVVGPAVVRHGGQVVKQTGDGFLASFASAIGAVQCALKVQRAMRENRGREPLVFRIGVHLGDVIVEAGDIHGNSVNLAFRLESLADPGGVLISEPVYSSVRASLPLLVEQLGEHRLGDPALATRAYRLAMPNGGRTTKHPSRAASGG